MKTWNELNHEAEELFIASEFHHAAKIWDQLIAERPEEPYPIYALGNVMAAMGNDGGAIVLLRQAASMTPANSHILAALGSVLRKNEHYDAARFCCERALTLDPENKAALKGLSGSYVNQGNPLPGIEIARQSLALYPEFHDARNDLGLLLLEAGQWEEGWACYRNRSKLPGYHVRDYGAVPRWNGERVSRLALHAEQGLGDELLFASCLPDVLRDVDSVAVEVNERLIPIFARSFPAVRFYPNHASLLAGEIYIDAWERLGDLPGRYRPNPWACPGTPYLKADPVKVIGYQARLAALGPPPYIGIAWIGGSRATHESLRIAPKDEWKKIVAAPGTKISVQYGPRAAGNAKEFGIPHWPGAIDDLDEFAALLCALDLVVTVCQTAVHFAGALAVPCWVATPSKPAWRYGLTGSIMPWYRSARLFRQNGDDWGAVFDAMASEMDGRQKVAAE